MKKMLLLLTILVGVQWAFAQQRTVTGRVIGEDGNPVPFASIRIKGSTTGTTSDADGKFLLKVQPDATLVISALGMQQKEVKVGGQTSLDILLQTSEVTLKEVIVTGAFGLKNTLRNTSYSAQVINSEQLNIIPHTDINSALAGKVAGTQFRGQSAMLLNRQGSLRMRGGLSLNDKDPVYVVDGTIVNSFDINPNDIESVTVLKGANATALFGDRASNGAIVITTKKKTGPGSGIEFSQGITVEKVYILPKYQNTYAGGGVDKLTQFVYQSYMPKEWKALDGKYFPDYTDDASWGPKMEGQEYVPWYAWYPGSKYSFKTARLVPQPNNARQFFETGITSNTNVSFGKSGDKYNYRLSYTNQAIKGMTPNSASQKNNFFATVSYDLNSHITAGFEGTYSTQRIEGVFEDGYANQSTGSFNSWFHRDLDMNILKELRNLKSPFGTLASWNLSTNPDGYDPNDPGYFYLGNYWYNFYSYFDNFNNVNNRDRLFGDFHVAYKLNKNFQVKGTIRKNQLTTNTENITRSILEKSASQSGLLASYYTQQTTYQEYNYELLATYNQQFKNFDVTVNAGGNILNTNYKDISAGTVNGLNVPDLYSISNSKSQPSIGNTRQSSETRSVFASGDLGYKKLINVNWALRNDWYSTLPISSNSLLSPSVGANFIFSSLTEHGLPWLSFGKVFGSWGKKPLPLEIYGTNFTYSVGQYQWNGNFLMTTPNTLIDPNLRGSLITSYEVGLDLRFKNNRFGVNVLYYHDNNDGEPVTIGIDGISGFTAKRVNAARIERKGIEAMLTFIPVVKKNFNWEINTTFGYLIGNKVRSLAQGQDKILVPSGPGRGFAFGSRFAQMYQELNQDWGQLIGGGIKRNENGQPLIQNDGTYIGDPNKHWGSVVPKVTGGLVNSLTYKDFTLNFSLDYQVGGKFFSLTENWGTFSGLLAPTAALNDKGKNVRDPVAQGGGVHVVGVSAADGKTVVDRYVDGYTYFHQYYFNRVAEPYIHDLSYVKLREISIGYRLPIKKWNLSSWIQDANVSLVARNPWLIYSAASNFDPSEISYLSGEEGQLPATRSIGFNVRFSF